MPDGSGPGAMTRAEVLTVMDLGDARGAGLDAAASSAFQLTGFARAHAAAGNHVIMLVVEGGGHVPLVERRSLGFGQWSGLAEPVVHDAPTFWRGLLAVARRHRVASASWRDLSTTRFAPGAVAEAARVCEAAGAEATRGAFSTRVVALDGAPSAWWDGFHRKQRNVIRAAERARLRVEPLTADDADAFTALSDVTWGRSEQTGPPSAYFRALLAATDLVEAIGARGPDGRLVAAAIATHSGGRATYLHGASADDAPTGAAALLQWETMQRLARRGVHTYDLGGDTLAGAPDDTLKLAGIRRFKERFGGHHVALDALHLKLDPTLYAEARAAVLAARGDPLARAPMP